MLKSWFLSACLLIPAIAVAEDAPLLSFPTAGFTIAGLDEAPPDTPHQALILFLPAEGGFAPNVNVRLQPFQGTMDEYRELNLKEIQQAKFKLLGEPVVKDDNSFVMEFTGNLQERTLRFYSRSVLSKGRVYLITATATDTQWPTVGEKLKACADSLKLTDKAATPEEAPKPAATEAPEKPAEPAKE